MTNERLAEIEVDDGYPMSDLEIELLEALRAERASHLETLQSADKLMDAAKKMTAKINRIMEML
jgi:hypothetical protein